MRARILLVLFLAAGVFVVRAGFLKYRTHRSGNQTPPVTTGTNSSSTPPTAVLIKKPAMAPSPTERASPWAVPSPEETSEASQPPTDASFVGILRLIIPVAGVRPDQLIDTFTAERSEGRVHDAIDIPAAAGTPVLAAADGQIVKLLQSERGGTTIYQSSSDKKIIFYYAHLSRYADSIAEGNYVHQGDLIAYVGDTGNAGPGNYHLHFSILVVSDPKRYWEGTNINPYPLLHR